MPDNMDEILDFLHQQGLTPEQSLEQLLIERILNPAERTMRRILIVEEPNNPYINQVREEIIINEQGFPEKVEEEIVNVCTLGDGTPMNTYGICRCQTCHRLVSVENLSRCVCGKTTCVMCSKYDAKTGIWFCSSWHKFVAKFYRLLKINFR